MNIELRDFLLTLGKLTRTVSAEQFKHEVFSAIQLYLRFDSGIWTEARPGDRYLYEHSRMLYNQPHEMMTSYFENAAEIDFLALAAMDSPGETVDIDNLISRQALVQHPIFQNHMTHFDITHSLCTAIQHEGTNVFSFISLYRSKEGDCFSERQRVLAQEMAPFLVDAYKSALFLSTKDGISDDRRPQHPMAIVDRYGIVFQQSKNWMEAINALTEDEVGTGLPKSILPLLDKSSIHQWGTAKLKTELMDNDLVFLQIFMDVATAQLTKAERTVAALYVQGKTRRSIAASLCRSEETVKIHLNNIYKKLKVNCKLELVRRLSDDPEI